MKSRRILSLIVAVVMLAGLIPAAGASAADGEAADIVIVLDRSAEMAAELSSGETKMAAARSIAKSCISALIDGNDNARVALVIFDKTSSVRYHFSRSKTLLRSTVNVISRSSESANIEAGLVEATNLLQTSGRAGAKQAILLISAGKVKYCNDILDREVVGTGLFELETYAEQTLDQAHLSRDFGAKLVSVYLGEDAGSQAEKLMMAAQDSGYHTASTASGSAVASEIFASQAFDTENAGECWSVGFAMESLVPDDLPFMSYEVADLPESGLLYSRDILNSDLSFDPDDLPQALRTLWDRYSAMNPNKYPGSMIKCAMTFINRVLPLDPPFNPELMLQYSASFAADLALHNSEMAAAESSLASGTEQILAARAAAYEQSGMTAEQAMVNAEANLAQFFASGSSFDPELDQAYIAMRDAVGGVSDYTLPNTRYYMAGYESDLFAKGYLDENHARAVYLDDNTGRGGVILVSVETVGMARADINRIRDRLAGFMLQTGIREIHVMSAHNHAALDSMGIWGPMLADGKDDEYMELVFDAIDAAARSAYSARKTGSLFVGYSDAGAQTGYPEPLVEDTRYPLVTENAEILTRFRFVPSDGSRELYIINFPVHLEALQDKNFTVSSDFLEPFEKYLAQNEDDADYIFFTGAEGGLIRTKRNQTITDGFVPRNFNHNYWKITQITGKRIGELTLGIANEIELEAKLNMTSVTFEAELENYILMLLARLDIINTRIYVKNRETGLRNTVNELAGTELLGEAAVNALSTYLTLKAQGTMSEKDMLVRALIGFGDTYWSMAEDNLIACAVTEMSYIELYQKNGSRIKGMFFMPGEIFGELVYGGMLEGGTGNWFLDPHNPGAAPIQTITEIASAAGKDYGTNNYDFLVFGQANDMIGYVIPPNDFLLNPTLPYLSNYKQGDKRNHYEETNSAGPNTAYVVADAFAALIAKAN